MCITLSHGIWNPLALDLLLLLLLLQIAAIWTVPPHAETDWERVCPLTGAAQLAQQPAMCSCAAKVTRVQCLL